MGVFVIEAQLAPGAYGESIGIPVLDSTVVAVWLWILLSLESGKGRAERRPADGGGWLTPN